MTDTRKELVKRLRAVNHMCVEDCFLQSPLFGHAADAIEALQARAEAAEAELADAASPEAELAAARAIYTPGPRQAVAEYPAQPSPEAVVKAALEWVQIGDNFWVARAPFFGTFRVESYGHGWDASWSVPGFSDAFVDGRFESAEDAIAAINAKVATTIAAIIAQAGKGAGDGNA